MLTYGIVYHALVPAQYMAVFVDIVSRLALYPSEALYGGRVVAVRHEAYVLAFALVSRDETCFVGDRPDVAFGQVTEREYDVRKRLLLQIIEHIALILSLVCGFHQPVFAVLTANPGVVPGRDIPASEHGREFPQPVEFEVTVAFDTGIRGLPALVCGYEIPDDLVPEIGFETYGVMVDSEESVSAQQVPSLGRPASALSYSFMVHPTHSYPASAISLAATDESTPPDMAISAFMNLSY